MTPFRSRELLATIHTDSDELAVDYVVVQSRRILSQGRIPLDQLDAVKADALRFAVLSPHAAVDHTTLELPGHSAKITELMLRRYISQELVIQGDYELRLCRHERDGDKVALEYVAIPDDDMVWMRRALPREQRPVRNIALIETAIAALVGQASRSPAIVFWARGDQIVGLIINRGRVLARRRVKMVSQALELDLEGDGDRGRYLQHLKAMSVQLDSIAKANFGINALVHLALGDLYPLLYTEEEEVESVALASPCCGPDSHDLIKRIRHLYSPSDVVCQGNAVLRYPELFGLPFVRNALNLCDREYQHQVRGTRLNRYTAAATGSAGFLLLASAVANFYEAGDAHASLVQDIRQHQSQFATINGQIPDRTQLSRLADTTALLQRETRLLRLDHFIDWLSHEIGGHGQITSLEIHPDDTPANTSTKGQKRDDSYQVTLEVRLQGDYDAGKQTAAALVWQLGQRTDIQKSRYDYDTDAPRPWQGRLKAVLIAHAGNFLNKEAGR